MSRCPISADSTSAGKDIGAAGDDHVGAAVGDVQVAVVVEVADIAGGGEAVRVVGNGGAPPR